MAELVNNSFLKLCIHMSPFIFHIAPLKPKNCDKKEKLGKTCFSKYGNINHL